MSSRRPAPRGAAAYPRKRAVKACQVCRARRTKCDNAKPACSFCVKAGAECVQSASDISSFDPASLCILERLNEIGTAIDRCQMTLETSSHVPLPHDASISTTRPSVPDASTQSTGPRPEGKVNHKLVLPQSIQSILAWQCFHLEPCHIIQPMDEMLDQQQSSPSVLAMDMMNPLHTNALLDAFFNHVHVKNPVLDERETRRVITSLFVHGLDWSPNSCLAMLVCALGSVTKSYESGEIVDTASSDYISGQYFFAAAQKRFGVVIGSGSLLESQCFFLAGVYMMSIFKRATAWRFFLNALACCQNFNFIRSPCDGAQSTSSPSSHDYSVPTLEQAVYWSSWKAEQEMRLELEPVDFMSTAKEIGLYPTFFPTPPMSHELGDANTQDDIAQHSNLAWFYFLSEISVRRLSFCVINQFLDLQSASGDDFVEKAAATISEQVARAKEWVTNLPGILSIEDPPEKDDICRFILRGQLLDLYEIIYWPFVYTAINDFRDSSPATPSPSSTLLKESAQAGLEKHVERLVVNRPGFYHRHHGTPRLIRTCTRSALVLMAAALQAKNCITRGSTPSLQLPVGWRDAVLAAVELNRFWSTESSDSQFLLQALEAVLASAGPLDNEIEHYHDYAS